VCVCVCARACMHLGVCTPECMRASGRACVCGHARTRTRTPAPTPAPPPTHLRHAALHLVLLHMVPRRQLLQLVGKVQELLVARHGVRHHLEGAHDLLQAGGQRGGRLGGGRTAGGCAAPPLPGGPRGGGEREGWRGASPPPGQRGRAGRVMLGEGLHACWCFNCRGSIVESHNCESTRFVSSFAPSSLSQGQWAPPSAPFAANRTASSTSSLAASTRRSDARSQSDTT